MADRGDTRDMHHKRLEFLGLDDSQKAILKSLQPTVKESIGAALDAFYKKVKATPETARFFREEAHMKAAKGLQATHWEKISSGALGRRSACRRRRHRGSRSRLRAGIWHR